MSLNPIYKINLNQARKFLVQHQGLAQPFEWHGQQGVLELFDRLGCIQFDPINVVGRNPDLVLQARVTNFTPDLLHDLLYRDRLLMDVWDKCASICRQDDWPYFSRYRERMEKAYQHMRPAAYDHALEHLEHLRLADPNLAKPANSTNTIIWDWGRPVRMERAALEILNATGRVGISNRVGNKKSYTLIEDLIPPEVLALPDTNASLEDYHDWHVLRRAGSLGLVQPGASEFWLGIQHMKTPERLASIQRLLEKGELIEVAIKELPDRRFYMRARDEPTLANAIKSRSASRRVVFLPPLDNLLWDRRMLSWLFNFDYTWEIYKKADTRRYGHYTMPVLYGDQFIARFEPGFDKVNKVLTIKNWWWENGIRPNPNILAAVKNAINSFLNYLNANEIFLTPKTKSQLEFE